MSDHDTEYTQRSALPSAMEPPTGPSMMSPSYMPSVRTHMHSQSAQLPPVQRAMSLRDRLRSRQATGGMGWKAALGATASHTPSDQSQNQPHSQSQFQPPQQPFQPQPPLHQQPYQPSHQQPQQQPQQQQQQQQQQPRLVTGLKLKSKKLKPLRLNKLVAKHQGTTLAQATLLQLHAGVRDRHGVEMQPPHIAEEEYGMEEEEPPVRLADAKTIDVHASDFTVDETDIVPHAGQTQLHVDGAHDVGDYMNFRRGDGHRVGAQGPGAEASTAYAYVESKTSGKFVQVGLHELEQLQENQQREQRGGEANAHTFALLEDEADSMIVGCQETYGVMSFWFLFFSGILAGASLFHIYAIQQRTNNSQFLSYYSIFADGARFMSFFLLILSCTDAFLRCSLEYSDPEIWYTRTRWGRARLVFLTILYFTALMCTLLAHKTEERILLEYSMNTTWFLTNTSVLTAFSSDLSSWYNLSWVRFFCTFFGWLLVCIEYVYHVSQKGKENKE